MVSGKKIGVPSMQLRQKADVEESTKVQMVENDQYTVEQCAETGGSKGLSKKCVSKLMARSFLF